MIRNLSAAVGRSRTHGQGVAPSGARRSGARTLRACGVITALLVLWACAAAFCDDWPTYRHDRARTGVSDEKLSLPLEQVWVFHSRQFGHAPTFTGDLAWEITPEYNRYTLPITAAGDSVFFSSAVDGRVVCLDAASARKKWEFVAGAAMNRTPNIKDGKVYIGSDDGNVYCLDAEKGTLVWKVKAAPLDRWFFSFDQFSSIWPVRTDVVVDKGVAYFGAGIFPHDGTFLYAVKADNGERVWRNDTFCEGNSMYPLAPFGYLYVSETDIYVPMEFKNFRFANILGFLRKDGSYHLWGSGELPAYAAGGPFWPYVGVVKDGVRYIGTSARGGKWENFWPEIKDEYQFDQDSIQGMGPVRGSPPRCDVDLAPIMYAGGVVYYVGYKVNPEARRVTGGAVIARDAKTGNKVWSAEIPEWPVEVIVANGRLFVSTRSGSIYAFAQKGSPAHATTTEMAKEDLPGSEEYAAAAENIVKASGVQDGYALVLDCETGGLALELAKRTNLRLCAVFHDEKKADAARAAFTEAGLHVKRVFVWHQAPGTALPYPQYFADLVVSESAAKGGALPKADEFERYLKPITGVAIIGGTKQEDKAVADWAASTKQKDWQVDGRWAKRVRPRLEGAGQWSCERGDAGNTMCSQDAALKPPLGVIWYGRPFSRRDSGAIQPAILAEGVLIGQDGTWAEGFDAYTGRMLWHLDHAFTDTVAAHGGVYLRYLETINRLEPRTGKVIKQYQPPVAGAKWERMAIDPEGKTLFAVSAKKTYGIDTETGNVLWQLPIPGWTAISDGHVYVVGGPAQGEMRQKALAEMKACLERQEQTALVKEFLSKLDKHGVAEMTVYDARTGKELLKTGVDNTNAGGAVLIPYTSGGRDKQQFPYVLGTVMAHGGEVIFGTFAAADKIWAVWPGGGYRSRAVCAYDGTTGKLLWYRFANCRAIPVVTDDVVIAEPWAFDLKTGEPKTRLHPITGEKATWAFCRYDKQCGVYNASRYFIFGRSRGIGYHDMYRDQGLYTFLNSRASCWIDTSSGAGMMIKPPHAISCRCETSMPFTVALGQVPNEPPEPQLFAQPGPTLPVKHLYLDMGATGDRRDSEGNLWITVYRPEGHPLLMGLGAKVELYDGGKPVQRSSMFTPIRNTDTPFVFATAIRGIKKLTVPVTKGAAANYRVAFGFSALPGDKPGQRVFSVRLNGKLVLDNLDIVKETGAPDTAMWKEFTVPIENDLVVEFTAVNAAPTPDQMPLINGLKVLRVE